MRRLIIYFGLFLIVLVNYVDRVNLSVAAGPIRKALDLTPVELGYVFSSFSWTYILFLVPLGRCVDRWGAQKILPASLAIWSLGGIFTGFSTVFTGLMASRLVLGAGEAVTYPAGGRIIRDWVPRAERGFAQAFMSSGQMFGPAFGAVFVGWLVDQFGWQLSFIVTGLAVLALAVIWAIVYRQPESVSWLGDAERKMILAGRDVSKSSSHESSRGILKTFLRSPTMWAIAFVQGCGIYTQYLFVNWLPTYLQTGRSLGIMSTGFLTAIPYLVAGVAVLLLAKLGDRLLTREAVLKGKRRTIIAACLLVSSVILVTPFLSSFWIILAVISVSLSCAAAATAMNVALTNDLLRDSKYAGTAASFAIFGGNLFGAFAPIVTGYAVASSYGFKGAFVIAGILLVLGAFVCFFLTEQPIDEQAQEQMQPLPQTV